MQKHRESLDSSESEGEESESKEESEDSDKEEVKETVSKKKEVAKPKKRVWFVDIESEDEKLPKNKLKLTEDVSMGMLIDKMKRLDLRDPESQALWVKVICKDQGMKNMLQQLSTMTIETPQSEVRDVPPHLTRERPRYDLCNEGYNREEKTCYRCRATRHNGMI